MERSTATTKLRVGDWCVDPSSCEISRDGQTARVDVRTMRLLVCLTERAGEVVSSDDLLDQVWSGVVVSQDSVYQSVASLRRLLGDDPKHPTYIATVPRLGYRLVATVSPWADRSVAQTPTPDEGLSPPAPTQSSSGTRSSKTFAWIAAISLGLVLVAAFMFEGARASNRSASSAVVPSSQKSIAVLPFLDLTEGMKEEEFADGMTAELIDKISKVPGLRVHAPVSALSLKGKREPIVDMAKMLDVAYVLDGNVRKSGGRLRIAARLIRANDEFVVWSRTYDRPETDVLSVQDDIARQVTDALVSSIERGTATP